MSNPTTDNKTTDSKPTENPPTESSTLKSPELDTLNKAADGLLFPSETDAPFIPFFWDNATTEAPTAELVAAKIGQPVSEVTSKSLKTLFAPMVQEQDWQNDEEKAGVKRFQALLDALNTSLQHPKAFRVGKIQIDIYIVGTVSGGYAGLQTKAVET